MTDLAVIIVSYNTRDDLARTLNSLVSAPPVTPHQIVVVDNASEDGSLGLVRDRYPDVRSIDAGANLGFSAANNIGIRATSGEFVLLLNSDTEVPRGAVDGLVHDLRQHPEAAIAGPRLVDARGRPELSIGPMIGPFNELKQKLTGALYERGWGPVCRRVERSLTTEQEVDWVSGACLLVRRADAEDVGLLDERFFLYTEDVDFCAAIRRRGRRVRFVPSVEVRHLRGRSRSRNPAAASAAYRRSHLAFYAKHHPGWHRVLRGYLRLRGQLPRA
jgi:N-acetylglucosaminyl-diphospho-decaprenol L-rhamnosyltransferase